MKIDINCDVGEGMTNEDLLFPFISSCNIACSGHFGDVISIDKTIKLAIENDVLIGAHPSFPDRENFGRKVMDISSDDLRKSIQNQLNLFLERLFKLKGKLHHIKPHGALYNLIAVDGEAANHFVETIEKYMENVFLYVPYNSVIEKVALKNNIKIKYEAFADRHYNDDLTLVSRVNKNAVITSPKEVFSHIYNMVFEGKVKTVTNFQKRIKVDTFCVHGDNENSLEILQFLPEEFAKKGIAVA